MIASESLWAFALDFYARPGVAPACLDLQERRQADVCVLLFAAWAGAACGHRLTEAELSDLHAATAAWRAEVVLALRHLRRRLKEGPPPAPDAATSALRRRIQNAEIEAERIELTTLAATVPLTPRPGPDEAAPALVRANLVLACPPRDAADEAALAALAESAAMPRG